MITTRKGKSDITELLFVCGSLRRDGSEAFRMEGAEFVATARASGELHLISSHPKLVLKAGAGIVTGEVFRVSPAHLSMFDDLAAGAANESEAGGCRRVSIIVWPLGLPTDESFKAWTYKWGGPMDETFRIDSGDWLEVIRPRTLPVFTAACLIFSPCAVPSLFFSFIAADWMATALILGPPVCGLIAAACGHQRRERWMVPRRMATGFCTVWLFVAGFFLLAMTMG